MTEARGRLGTLQRCVSCRKYANSVHLVDGTCPECRAKKRPGSRARSAKTAGQPGERTAQPQDIARLCREEGWILDLDEAGMQVWHTFSRDGRYLRVCLSPRGIWFAMAPTGDAPRTSALTSYEYGTDAVGIGEVIHRMTLEREAVRWDREWLERIAEADIAQLRALAAHEARPGDEALKGEYHRLEKHRWDVALIGAAGGPANDVGPGADGS
jgi:hypothetical protein